MRAIIVAVFFAGAIFTLQGCGGGGSSCTNALADLVTQSFTSKLAGTASYKGISKTTTGQATVKMDAKIGNVRIDIDGNVRNVSGNFTIAEKMIINIDKQLVVSREIVKDSAGKTLEDKCQKMDISLYASLIPAMLQQAFHKMNCGGNDGTYDTWKLGFQGNDPQDPTHPGTSFPGDYSMDIEVQMGKDYLIHSGKTTVSVRPDASGKGSDVQSSQTMTVTQGPSPQGPSPADLDEYVNWGNCTSSAQFPGFKLDTSGVMKVFISTLHSALPVQSKEVVV